MPLPLAKHMLPLPLNKQFTSFSTMSLPIQLTALFTGLVTWSCAPMRMQAFSQRDQLPQQSGSSHLPFGKWSVSTVHWCHTLQLIGLSISKAYSSLLCNATRTFQLHLTAPSLDLYSFLTLEDTYPVSTLPPKLEIYTGRKLISAKAKRPTFAPS